jgi:hypothetical protein
MLRSRWVEPPSPDLAEKIILRAQSIPQSRAFTLAQWLGRLFAEFHLPRPAYVLASALVLGFVVGISAPSDTTTGDQPDTPSVQGFLYADEDLL